MNQSQILIAEMSDADGIQVCVKTRVAHGLVQELRGRHQVDAVGPAAAHQRGRLLHGLQARVYALRDVLEPETEIGFHGHHNMGIANSIAAIEAGASRIDASVAGFGAGAGNTPMEVLAAVCERMGIETGVDLFQLMDVAEDIIVPMMDHLVRIDRESPTLGYAGVYSTFVLPAKRAAERFGVPARDILVELGRLKMIGRQEDMIVDTAMSMAKERGLLKDVVRAR